MGAVSNATGQVGWVSGTLVSDLDDNYLGELEWNGSRVFDARGRIVGFVQASGDIYDASQRRLGHVHDTATAVTDTTGRIIGYVEDAGLSGSMEVKARGAAARLLLWGAGSDRAES